MKGDLILRWLRHHSPLLLLVSSFTLLSVSACNKPATETEKKIDHSNSHNSEPVSTTDAPIPRSLVAEHKELHELLEQAIRSGGKTGEAAKAVAERLDPHFKKEEEYAMPPLSLLAPLAQGKVSADMKKMMELSEKLKADLPRMLDEHKAIVVTLDSLELAAKEENKQAVIAFVEKLRLHAQTEEEILYPAAILVGDYLRLRLEPASERSSTNTSQSGNLR